MCVAAIAVRHRVPAVSSPPPLPKFWTLDFETRPCSLHYIVMAVSSPRHSRDRPNGEQGDCAGASCEDGIPVVDLDVLLNGDAGQRSQAIQDLGRACEDWGFFMVINHGVPEALQEAVIDAYKELFSLPREEKAGYMTAGPKDPIRIGTGFFYSAVDGTICRRDYVKTIAHPEFHCPAKPAKLREVAMEYSTCTRELLLELAKAISESLGLSGGRISEALDLESCFQVLVANNYPPSAGLDDGVMGISAHSDHGLLTLLFQNGVDGLQVKHNDHWILATPLPGSLFVITGDQLEIVTNGRYKAVVHRALVRGEQTRMSFVSLIGPCLDAIVEPVPELVHAQQSMKFRGIKYKDYMDLQQSSKINEKAALNIVRVQHDILTCND